MKSIYSIFVAGVFYSLLASFAAAADNFSLWPRRPEELEQARRLMQEQKGGEAVLLLQPFLTDMWPCQCAALSFPYASGSQGVHRSQGG